MTTRGGPSAAPWCSIIFRGLTRAVEHYRDVGVRRWMLQLLPHVEPAGFAGTAARHGVIRLRGWSKHLGRPELEVRPASALRVVRLGAEGSAGVGSDPSLAEAWADIAVRLFGFPAPFATGALFLSESDAGVVGQLTFAGTLPEYRRRGAQSALLARRVEDARAAGARRMVSETDEPHPDRPNPSTRNLTRLGFPVVWVRANWGSPKPEE